MVDAVDGFLEEVCELSDAAELHGSTPKTFSEDIAGHGRQFAKLSKVALYDNEQTDSPEATPEPDGPAQLPAALPDRHLYPVLPAIVDERDDVL